NLISSIDGGLRINFWLDDLSIVTELENIKGCKLTVSDQDITIHCADRRVVDEVKRVLEHNNCNFHDFTVSKPTLEDVFLSITGKEMRE
ncbi:hypothetical protein M1O56_05825, partial [Dehalococcoidia bacterium]|nr:hypothetical protein [Dehalococcoidia bacterium]